MDVYTFHPVRSKSDRNQPKITVDYLRQFLSCRCLPFDLVSRIWDLFLFEGDIVLFKVCQALQAKYCPSQVSLGILKHYHLVESSVVPSSSTSSSFVERLWIFLSSSSTIHFEAIQPERFLELVASVSPTKEHLLKIMKVVRQINEEATRQSSPLNSISALLGHSGSYQNIDAGTRLETPDYAESLELTDDNDLASGFDGSAGSGEVKTPARYMVERQGMMTDLGTDDGSATPASSFCNGWGHSESLVAPSPKASSGSEMPCTMRHSTITRNSKLSSEWTPHERSSSGAAEPDKISRECFGSSAITDYLSKSKGPSESSLTHTTSIGSHLNRFPSPFRRLRSTSIPSSSHGAHFLPSPIFQSSQQSAKPSEVNTSTAEASIPEDGQLLSAIGRPSDVAGSLLSKSTTKKSVLRIFQSNGRTSSKPSGSA